MQSVSSALQVYARSGKVSHGAMAAHLYGPRLAALVSLVVTTCVFGGAVRPPPASTPAPARARAPAASAAPAPLLPTLLTAYRASLRWSLLFVCPGVLPYPASRHHAPLRPHTLGGMGRTAEASRDLPVPGGTAVNWALAWNVNEPC